MTEIMTLSDEFSEKTSALASDEEENVQPTGRVFYVAAGKPGSKKAG